MPNWCENDLWVRGVPEEVQRFVTHAASADGESAFDFNRFAQMPEGLESVQAGSVEEVYVAWYGTDAEVVEMLAYPWLAGKANDREELKATLAKKYSDAGKDAAKIANNYRDNVEQYGFKTWLDWAIANWGTKWNAGEVKQPEIRKGGRLAFYRFDTAWSPPLSLVEAASKKFPNVRLTMRFYEAGSGFKGILVCKGGQILKSESSDYDGGRGG